MAVLAYKISKYIDCHRPMAINFPSLRSPTHSYVQTIRTDYILIKTSVCPTAEAHTHTHTQHTHTPAGGSLQVGLSSHQNWTAQLIAIKAELPVMADIMVMYVWQL